ncbi:hypothetical protein [Paenibacillus polymyxa]|uniref:hypothetical protein n=1 Tax=Paenibacillus polymyxa TaxID=1406 RepID=UPI0023789B2D|nr:hypothetical protein [Paenibacillus polymyxa]WDM22659.1 hypothetical protein J4I02_03295 [Paenibacillus polymyxa]
MKKIDLTGSQFGRLKVLSQNISKKGQARWNCLCECGNTKVIRSQELRNGKSKSCGCLRKEMLTKHSRCSSPEYITWVSMKTRCYRPNNSEYKNYGGRGIKICDEWVNDFERFYEDMGNRPTIHHSIDRIDVNGNYEPSNCRWATSTEQARNKRPLSSKTGVPGVRNNGKRKDWLVTIGNIYIGNYLSFEEAVEARKKAEKKYWGVLS